MTDLPAVPGLEMDACYHPADSREFVGGDWYDAAFLPAPQDPGGEVLAVCVGNGRWALTWSNAGHPPPILVEPAGTTVVLDGHDILFGYLRLRPGPRRDHHRDRSPTREEDGVRLTVVCSRCDPGSTGLRNTLKGARRTMAETATSSRTAMSSYDPVPAAATRIRHGLRALLRSWGLAADRIEDALVVVEELVANVLDHARTRFELSVRLAGDVLHLAVRDHSVGSPHLRAFDPQAVRGRGLQMVNALAVRWGYEQHSDGKTVWAEL